MVNWQIETIKLLVEKGADVNVKGSFGYSSLEIAQKKGWLY